ncbi:hypothetical protein JYQ62_10665 [Nostoc sp. UHCC 0702]|nr:hypothetical protein JYQ62_10665 [Nostoc sp. UHCC 0702]
MALEAIALDHQDSSACVPLTEAGVHMETCVMGLSLPPMGFVTFQLSSFAVCRLLRVSLFDAAPDG